MTTIESIDAEIARLSNEIIRLRSVRNSLTPVSKLPPEITSKVFVFVADGRSASKSKKWIPSATHVCRRWREIALDTPELWRAISFSRHHWQNPEWIEELCKRAERFVGLEIELERGCSAQEWEWVFAAMPQTRHVSLIRQSLVPLSASAISADTHTQTWEDQPGLQRLSLSSCNVDWDNFVFPARGLTHFDLSVDPTVFFGSKLSLESFMTLLVGMPHLQVLSLKNCFLNSSAPPSVIAPSSPSIPANNAPKYSSLRALVLHLQFAHIAFLLSVLPLQELKYLDINDAGATPFESELYASLLASISELGYPDHPLVRLQPRYHAIDITDYQIITKSRSSPPTNQFTDPAPIDLDHAKGFSIALQHYQRSSTIAMSREILRILRPVTENALSLEIGYVTGSGSLDGQQWEFVASLLRASTRVEKIHLSHSTGLKALSVIFNSSSNSADGTPLSLPISTRSGGFQWESIDETLCPSLSEVEAAIPPQWRSQSIPESIEGIILSRWQSGCPLKRVVLSGYCGRDYSGYFHRCVEVIRRLGAEVVEPTN